MDLHQIHRWDYETPIEETMEALAWLLRKQPVAEPIVGRRRSRIRETPSAPCPSG